MKSQGSVFPEAVDGRGGDQRTRGRRTPSAPQTQADMDPLLAALHIGKNARTLGASVTNAVRQAIIRGQFPPGEALGQEYLSRLFGVSRVPIRECLQQLAAEGLVEIVPHKGAVVARLSLEELDELYGIIWSLETLAAQIAVPKLSDAEIAAMRAVIEQLDLIEDPVLWYETSVAFHRMILTASGWTRCLRIVDECRRNIGRYILEESFFASHVAQWRARNRVLFEACAARDAEAAVDALNVMRSLSTAQIREHLKASLARQQPG